MNVKNKHEVYKCSICGNIVEVLHVGNGELVCCGKPMDLQEEKTQDPVLGEKHVPVIEVTENGVKIKIGEVPHPMTEEHYIEWIEVISGNIVYRQDLKPGDNPSAEFLISREELIVRAYCNLHGLWKNV